MPITANTRPSIASSAGVPTRIAPWRSRSRRSVSALRASRAASAASCCSVAALISPTSVTRSPYSGTSVRYMSDMACANRLRMRSGVTKAVMGFCADASGVGPAEVRIVAGRAGTGQFSRGSAFTVRVGDVAKDDLTIHRQDRSLTDIQRPGSAIQSLLSGSSGPSFADFQGEALPVSAYPQCNLSSPQRVVRDLRLNQCDSLDSTEP